MSSLVILAIIAFVILYKAGPAKRADWKQQVERALAPELDRVREHPNMPERFRKKPAPSRIIGRDTPPPPPTGRPTPMPPKGRFSTPPPPTGRPQPPAFPRSSLPPPPTGEPVVDEPTFTHESTVDPVEPVVVEHDPPPMPADPVVIEVPRAEAVDAAPSEPEVDLVADEQATDASPTTDVDLDRDAVIAVLFGRGEPAHVRAATFADAYAGREVTWQATLVRTAKGRRHREPATRAELVLGYTSERQMFSDRVVAEAYFGPDVELERDSEVTVRGVLAEANVYANRVVLDHVDVV